MAAVTDRAVSAVRLIFCNYGGEKTKFYTGDSSFRSNPNVQPLTLYNTWYVTEMPGGTWVNFCWVCATGLSEPLPHYSQEP